MKGFKISLFFFLPIILLWYVSAPGAELMSTMCEKGVVSIGARRGEVIAKCGQPLNKSRDTVAESRWEMKKESLTRKKKTESSPIKKKVHREKEEVWTYVIDGAYRFFVFREGKLSRIETGGLAH